MIVGPFELQQGIYCDYEVLGKIYSTTIAGIDVSISFPIYNNVDCDDDFDRIGSSNPLLPPRIGRTWHSGDEKLDWGYPCCYPDIISSVSLLAFSVDCEADNEEDVAYALYDESNRWRNSFFQYCILVSGQSFEKKEITPLRYSILELYGQNGYIPAYNPIRITLPLHNHDHSLSDKKIKEAIEFASSGKELYLEYQMLLAALEARDSDRYRYAIVDACSALELCFVKVISKYCIEHDVDEDIILSKYRTLGERYQLIKKIDGSFNISEIDTKVIKLRNDIAHNRNVTPSKTETNDLIKKVEECLKFYFEGFYDSV